MNHQKIKVPTKNNPFLQPKGLEGLAQNLILTFKNGTKIAVTIPAMIDKGEELTISKIEVTPPYELPKDTTFKLVGPDFKSN